MSSYRLLVAALVLAVPSAVWGQAGPSAPADLPPTLDVTGFAVHNPPPGKGSCARPDPKTNNGWKLKEGISDLVAVGLTGKEVGSSLGLEVRADSAIQSVAVYSEPSHTLLGFLVDSRISSTDLERWLASESAHANVKSRVTRADLTAGSVIALQAPVPAPADTQIYAYLRGMYPVQGGKVESQEHLFKVATRTRGFQFTYREFREAEGDIDPTLCCGDEQCGSCIDCADSPKGGGWSCCMDTGSCGFCGNQFACCSPQQCYFC